MQISRIDFVILVLYLAGITLFGARFRRGQKDLRDYFLGGRSAPWWAIACSIVATETSTLTIIGTPGIAYGGNLGFLQLVLGYLVARVILCVVLIPQYFQGEFYTAYQLLERRFGARMKSAAAVVFLGTRALAEGVRISAIGKVVSVAFGTGERISIFLVAVLTIFYTFEGGMRAVIWTDVIQFVLYLTGSIVAFFLLAAQDSRRMARRDASGSRGGQQAFDLRFFAEPHSAIHVLGRPDRGHVFDDGEPRHRSNDGAAAAFGAQRTRQQKGLARERRDRFRAIRAVSRDWRHAVRLHSTHGVSASHERRRQNLSRIHRARNASGPLRDSSSPQSLQLRCRTRAAH